MKVTSHWWICWKRGMRSSNSFRNPLGTVLMTFCILHVHHKVLPVGASEPLPHTTDDGSEFYTFAPPEYFFADYWEPPPTEDTLQPERPSRPPIPGFPPIRPSSPSPPPPPPPNAAVPQLRLFGGNDGSKGVVQIWDRAAEDWGAFCVFKSEVGNLKKWQGSDKDVAILICKQLNLPFTDATLVSPEHFMPLSKAQMMRAKILGTWPEYYCSNPLDARSIFDCDGIKVLPSLAPSCMAAARAFASADLGRVNFVPVGVDCIGQRAALPPPNEPPTAPPPSPAINYDMRIVDIKTGVPFTSTEGAQQGLVRGRLQVLLKGSADAEARWGTICGGVYMDDDIAKYACKSNGFLWRTATIDRGARRPGLSPRDGTPIHLIAMYNCKLQPDGLACAIVANYSDARATIRNRDAYLPYGTRGLLKWALDFCDPVDGRGHQGDVLVRCEDSYPPPPSMPLPPQPSSRPPPLTVLNGVQTRFTEYFTNVYGVEFGVRTPGSTNISWGTVCFQGYDDNALLSISIANGLCSQITAGARPYGAIWYLQEIPPIPGVPPAEQRRNTPFVLKNLNCSSAGSFPPNISYCQAKPMDVVPTPVAAAPECNIIPWSDRLLSCMATQFLYNTPAIASLRLVGGSDGGYGRLEVLVGREMNRGWGTVCAADFEQVHAQAVCRDLGQPWTQASVRRASEFPELPSPPPFIHIDTVSCHANYNPSWFGNVNRTRAMSFIRDCQRGWPGSIIRICEHDDDVVVVCGGEAVDPITPEAPPEPLPVLPPFPVTIPGGTDCFGHYGMYGSYGGYHGGYGCYGGHGIRGGYRVHGCYGGHGGYGGYGSYGSYGHYDCWSAVDYIDDVDALLKVADDLLTEEAWLIY